MKIRFGEVQSPSQPSQIDASWQRIHSPKNSIGFLIAGFVGLLIPFVFVTILVIVSLFGTQPKTNETLSWGAVILAFVVFIPAHELLHVICYPNWQSSENVILTVVPKKVRIGIYYEGCMTRNRWMFMRLFPFVVMSLLPLLALSLFQFVSVSYALNVFLQVLMLANGIGSGGDLIAVLIVKRQVPPQSQICFKDGLAYWHP